MNVEILLANLNLLFFIVLVWSFLFFVFLGIGFLIGCLSRVKLCMEENALMLFWLGWVHSIFFLLIWNFFWPVNVFAFVFISVLGLVGSGFAVREFSPFIHLTTRWKVYIGVVGLMGFWLAFRLTTGQWNYDSGLYYIPTIHWISSYPVIPGLANLHGRLAYNCAYFLYTAMLDMKSSHLISCAFANGILYWVLLADIVLSWFRIFKAKGTSELTDIYSALLILPLLMIRNIFTPSPDIALIFMVFLLSKHYLKFLVSVNTNNHRDIFHLYFILALATFGVMVKLNFLIFALAIVVFTLQHVWRKQRDRPHIYTNKIILKIAVVVIGIIGLWIWRGIILSGYILFPSPLLPLPVSWRVPKESVVNLANWIYAWPRQHQVIHWNEVLGNWNWLGDWFARVTCDPVVLVLPLGLAVGSLSVLLYLGFKKKSTMNLPKYYCPFLAPALFAFIAWFFLAPEPRYGSIFAWVLAIGSLAFLICAYLHPKLILIYLTVFLLIVIKCPFEIQKQGRMSAIASHQNPFLGANPKRLSLNDWHRFTHQMINLPGIPESKVKTYLTRYGLILTVPVRGDQCWEAVLPCTPYPHPRLRLRKTGHMSSGFMIDPYVEKDASVGMHEQWDAKKWQ